MIKIPKRGGLLSAVTGQRFSRRISNHAPSDLHRLRDTDGYQKHASFDGDILIVGWGAIAQGLITLMLRHLRIDRERITILSRDEDGRELAEALDLRFEIVTINRTNIREVITEYAEPESLVVSLAVDVSSAELIKLCRELNCIYVDTSFEPWAREYVAAAEEMRTTYAFRQQALDLQASAGPGTPSALVGHGANPGLISHFAKEAIWAAAGREGQAPALTSAEWAQLVGQSGIRTIQLSELDTQIAPEPEDLDLRNTWSVDAYIGEALQSGEIASDAQDEIPVPGAKGFGFGPGGAYYLPRPGAWTPTKGWEPRTGSFTGMLFTHYEVLSLADYLTTRGKTGEPVSRPTVFYTYRPGVQALQTLERACADEKAIMARNKRILMAELTGGSDNVGAIAYREDGQAFWFGSCLDIDEARSLAPFNNATSLQVCAGALAGIVWIIENPRAGLIEAEALDNRRCMDIAAPYLGDLSTHRFDWRSSLEDLRFASFLSEDPVVSAPFKIEDHQSRYG
jgi:homospermidine synthase